MLFLWMTIATSALSQKVTTEVTVFNDLLFSDPRVFKPPKNGIPLEKKFSFPEEPLTAGARISQDAHGSIYVADPQTKSITQFTATGKREAIYIASKRAWNSMSAPQHIAIKDQTLFVQDLLRQTIEVFSIEGRLIKTLPIKNPVDFVVSQTGFVYVAPLILAKQSSLIEVYAPEGKKVTIFGEPRHMPFVDPELETIRLAIGHDGDILVAFGHFPIVQCYSSQGQLTREFRIETPTTMIKETFNLKRIGEGIAQSGRRFGYVSVLSAISVLGDRIFLLSCFPRVEIIEIDREGKITKTYWNDEEDISQAGDLLAQEKDGELLFYVLRTSPQCDIVVFGKKTAPGSIHSLPRDVAFSPSKF